MGDMVVFFSFGLDKNMKWFCFVLFFFGFGGVWFEWYFLSLFVFDGRVIGFR